MEMRVKETENEKNELKKRMDNIKRQCDLKYNEILQENWVLQEKLQECKAKFGINLSKIYHHQF